MRRDFALPADDMAWLEDRCEPYELVSENGILRVVMYKIPVPSDYNVTEVAGYVRIDPGYPDTQIDMIYFYPALSLTSGRPIGSTSMETFDDKTWQRWSRHRTPANPWRPGIDNLATHFALVQFWLEREARKV